MLDDLQFTDWTVKRAPDTSVGDVVGTRNRTMRHLGVKFSFLITFP